MRILIVDDEHDVALSIRDILGKRYIVDIAHTGSDGVYKACINEYDLIILDYILPDIDGVAVCYELRKASITTPILFLTGKYTIRDKVKAFDSGADDYLVKPFSTKELLVRVRAILRRSVKDYTQNTLVCDELAIDTIRRKVTLKQESIRLRKRAYDLLEYLARNKNKVLTRGMILEHVWEKGMDEESNTVDVHIKYLRDKLDRPYGNSYIRTFYGMGYSLSTSESS